MGNEVTILIIEAMAVYFLVLWAHSLRHRFGPVHFYALIGGITAVMSWVTDAGVAIQVGGITFVVGSTVFYTSLLLGVFVVYVFDGPRATRIAISTVVGISAIVPIIAATLHMQMDFIGNARLAYVPLPSLRINTASVFTTLIDLFFLAMVWEYLGKPNLNLKLWIRTFLTLLGVMWLDVLLFATGAFAGTPAYLSIMKGTLISRFIISVFAFPFLYFYLYWQNKKTGIEIENRPVLAILKQVAEIELELSHAQQEIERRKKAEEKLAEYRNNLEEKVKERTDELEDVNLKLQREISERKKAGEELRKSEAQLMESNQLLMGVLEHTHMMAVFLDLRFNFIWVNRAYADTCRYEPSFFPGKNHFDLYPHEENQKIFQRVVNSGEPFFVAAKPFEFPDQPARGVTYWDWSLIPVKKETGKVTGLVFTLVEVTERKQAEEQIKTSLKEKEVLIQEIHHRVKNNMQIISSLLKLQTSSSKDKKVEDALKESQGRVQAMSLVHETLYDMANMDLIDFRLYISRLSKTVFQAYGVSREQVELKIEAENISFGIDQATHIGLLINELVSNSLKYAFPGNRKGEIVIRLYKIDQDEIELTIGDNGLGIPEDLDWRNTESLGLRIVIILAENQLDGTVSLDREKGTHFTVKFSGNE